MSVAVYLEAGLTGTAPKWSTAFAKGCGGRVTSPPFDRGVPFAFWGQPRLWRQFVSARATCPAWYYGDHAFFGRGRFYRCAKGQLQFRGESGNDDPARFRAFGIPVRDWRSIGSHVLLCPNSEAFFALQGMAAGQWISETTAQIRQHTDRPIKIRWKSEAAERPLEQDLTDCWAVVTFVSNAAVVAVLAGVPAFCTTDCAGATMGSRALAAIEQPAMPEGRERWAARLANHQWTLDEMRRGALWNAIGG